MSNSNSMTAHLWAQQEKSRAQSSNGNMSFDGPTLYSYSTPIGRFVTAKKATVVLVTSRRYSITTSGKHMPALNRAIARHEQIAAVFTVPDVAATSKRDHEANLAYLVERYSEGAQKAARAALHSWRAPVSELNLATELESYAAKAIRYAKLFGLKVPRLNAAKLAREVMEKRREREARHNTPAEIAKREKAAKAREALAARREELARAETAERVAAWRNGEPVQFRYGEGIANYGRNSPSAMLRVRGDKLETSLGATVPLDHAVRVFRFVKLCRERGEGWQRNGRSLRVGHFQVDSVEPNGDFRAGCHFIAWAETEAAARQAGVADATPADTREETLAA